MSRTSEPGRALLAFAPLLAATTAATTRRRRASPEHSRRVIRIESAIRDEIRMSACLARRERIGRRWWVRHLARVGESRGCRAECKCDQHEAERKKLPQDDYLHVSDKRQTSEEGDRLAVRFSQTPAEPFG